MSGRIQTRVLREPWDVDRRLAELGLDRQKLLTVAEVAVHEAANATPFHPINAAGTFAYHQGTWALRDQFVGRGGGEWECDRADGVEAIRNRSKKLRVIFSNVDISCDDRIDPKPRSRKGSGSERACSGNLFGHLPTFARQPVSDEAAFYLMVDEKGNVELTQPTVEGGTFKEYIERIYLYNAKDGGPDGKLSLDDDDVADGFEPDIVRK